MPSLARPNRKKEERLEARVSPETKALFLEAAAIQGRSLTDFLLASAMEAATRTLKDREFLDLSKRDRTALVEALLNPPRPNAQLMQAAARYRQMFR
jgi:uncharacterized protein (DUF1778 family)